METQSAIPVTSVAHPHHPMDEPDFPLPHWMQTPQLPTPDDPHPTPSRQTHLLRHQTYANLFESSLERIMGGTPLTTIIANDPRGIQLGRFLFWINRDATRKQRYEEACEIAAEAMAHELTAIADALGGEGGTSQLEDVQRSSLRVKARTYLMEKWSPRRYGDTRRVQIDSTTINASMTAEDLTRLSLDELRTMAARVFASRATPDNTIDVTPADDTPLDEEAA
jgi:hypothetical protein